GAAATDGGALARTLADLLRADDGAAPDVAPGVTLGGVAPDGDAVPRGTSDGEAVRGDGTLRVDAARVDALVVLAGELVAARSALGHVAARAQDADAAGLARALRDSDAALGRLTAQLHRGVVSLRLVPLAQVFRRFGSPVRALARATGKEVALTLHGGDIEAEKAVVDGLYEPLLHVIRNAVDHGIEDGAGRAAGGKPAAGRIALRAEAAGDAIVVTVADDGAGIDPDLVRRRAAERGLLGPEAAAALDDAGALDLVFVPGFSTARRVSSLSGRGVGMDAVRAAAARLGGQASIASRVGRGTTVRLVLPRTIALTRIVLVGVGPELYGVPMQAVAEAVRVPRARIVALGDAAATVLRDRTVPVLQLARLLGVPDAAPPPGEARLLVVGTGPERVAVEVDRFADRLDVVVRPLSGLLAGLPSVAGTAILGDGRVLLVLDPADLVAGAGDPGGREADA
ncbi:chemotaxis protein CheA, partial [Methylobacterium crusticola]